MVREVFFRISISEGDDYPFIVQLVEGSKAQTQGAIFPGLVFTEIDGNSVVGKSEREVKAMLKASAAPRLTVPHGAPDAANIFEKLHRFEELEKARFAQWEEAYVEYDRLSDAEKKARSLGTDEKHKPVPRPPDFLARMPNGEKQYESKAIKTAMSSLENNVLQLQKKYQVLKERCGTPTHRYIANEDGECPAIEALVHQRLGTLNADLDAWHGQLATFAGDTFVKAALMPGERVVARLGTLGMVGLPDAVKSTFWGSGLVLLTHVQGQEQQGRMVSPDGQELYHGSQGQRRLLFVMEETKTAYTASEVHKSRGHERVDVNEVFGESDYFASREQEAAFSSLYVDNNVLQTVVQLKDATALKRRWEYGRVDNQHLACCNICACCSLPRLCPWCYCCGCPKGGYRCGFICCPLLGFLSYDCCPPAKTEPIEGVELLLNARPDAAELVESRLGTKRKGKRTNDFEISLSGLRNYAKEEEEEEQEAIRHHTLSISYFSDITLRVEECLVVLDPSKTTPQAAYSFASQCRSNGDATKRASEAAGVRGLTGTRKDITFMRKLKLKAERTSLGFMDSMGDCLKECGACCEACCPCCCGGKKEK